MLVAVPLPVDGAVEAVEPIAATHMVAGCEISIVAEAAATPQGIAAPPSPGGGGVAVGCATAPVDSATVHLLDGVAEAAHPPLPANVSSSPSPPTQLCDKGCGGDGRGFGRGM